MKFFLRISIKSHKPVQLFDPKKKIVQQKQKKVIYWSMFPATLCLTYPSGKLPQDPKKEKWFSKKPYTPVSFLFFRHTKCIPRT